MSSPEGHGPAAVAAAFAIGLLFGEGLIVSRMADPAKVLAFLDLAGPWDPSLALVMAGAIAVGSVGFLLAGRRAKSLLGYPMRLASARQIDRPLVAGGLLFGVGWGLAGFCPGPALVAVGAGYGKALVFVAAMIAGMFACEIFFARRRDARPSTGAQRRRPCSRARRARLSGAALRAA